MEYPRNAMHYPNGTFGRRAAFERESPPQGNASLSHQKNSCLDGASLAMVYSPSQQFEKLYEPMEGLKNGTIFCKLNLPFMGNRK